jgi:hypothetical protein
VQAAGVGFSTYWLGLRQPWALSPGSGTWSGAGFEWEDASATGPTELPSDLASRNSPGYSHWVKLSASSPEPNGQACAYADRPTRYSYFSGSTLSDRTAVNYYWAGNATDVSGWVDLACTYTDSSMHYICELEREWSHMCWWRACCCCWVRTDNRAQPGVLSHAGPSQAAQRLCVWPRPPPGSVPAAAMSACPLLQSPAAPQARPSKPAPASCGRAAAAAALQRRAAGQ